VIGHRCAEIRKGQEILNLEADYLAAKDSKWRTRNLNFDSRVRFYEFIDGWGGCMAQRKTEQLFCSQ